MCQIKFIRKGIPRSKKSSKKVFPEAVEVVAAEAAIAGRTLRIMFQDEARFGWLPVIRSALGATGSPPGCFSGD